MGDRYTITERVDAGGMAEVFRGVAESLQGFKKSVAIKRILPNLAKNKKFVAMFLDEAKLSLFLQHANIVQVFDIGQTQNSYFLVMEYVDGCNLKALLDRLKQRGKRMEIGHAIYRPSSWTSDPFCDNTCYGYAANVRTEDVVYPDDKEDRDRWSRDQLIDALRADGFGNPILQVPNSSTNGNGGHFLVALLDLRGTDKGDFHFLRLDHSGTWSQKVSTDPVTQRDQQTPKRKLTDLCAAQFFSAYTFVGFFVINDAVQDLLRQRGNP